MSPVLFDASGKRLNLSARLGKGGEGEVYAIDGSETVVKYYTVHDFQTREPKIRLMVGKGLAAASPLTAFPLAMVFNQSRKFAGFTMAKVAGHKPLHELYSPGARKVSFPHANYRFLTLTASNIARAIGMTNSTGCVVGDINHSGILISQNAKVSLIDADSFQIADGATLYPCKVGVPEYTPPELQGKRLATIVRTENHDAFGLAIAVFQLLFMGRHPFSGRYTGGDMPLEKAIGEFRFAYSGKRSVGMSPPPGVPTLADFPATIGDAFEAAFGPNGVTNRPSAKYWISLLDALKDSLTVCKTNSLHQYAQSAPECPWCRMEKRFLVPLFLPVIVAVDLGTTSRPVFGDIVAIWRAIEAVRPPTRTAFPQFTGPIPNPSPDAQEAAGKVKNKKLGAGAAAAIALVLFAIGPPIFIMLGIMLLFTAGVLFLSKAPNSAALEAAYRAALSRLDDQEVLWEKCNNGEEFQDFKKALSNKKSEFDGLPELLKLRLDEYARNRRTNQLNHYLSSQLIKDHTISKIGTGRRNVLLSFNIESAFDVTEQAVLNVPGFGPKTAQPLLDWRRMIESRFVFNTAQSPTDQAAIATIKAQINQRSTELKSALSMEPSKLTQLAQATSVKQAAFLPLIEIIHKQIAQITVDLNTLRIPVPNVAKRTSLMLNSGTTNTQSPAWQPGVRTPACPKCGGKMVIRTARRGSNAGSQFFGCNRYPSCNGTRPYP